MCVSCAAIPMTLSVAAAANAKQKQARRRTAPLKGVMRWLLHVPVLLVALVIVALLLLTSALIHSRIGLA